MSAHTLTFQNNMIRFGISGVQQVTIPNIGQARNPGFIAGARGTASGCTCYVTPAVLVNYIPTVSGTFDNGAEILVTGSVGNVITFVQTSPTQKFFGLIPV